MSADVSLYKGLFGLLLELLPAVGCAPLFHPYFSLFSLSTFEDPHMSINVTP
jgi:hypothetical protein